MDLDQEKSPVKAQRQNVVFGCPCEKGDCANNGSCVVNFTTPLVKVCKCVGTWDGLRCEKGEELPGIGDLPREYFWYYKRTKETRQKRTDQERKTTERLAKNQTGEQTDEEKETTNEQTGQPTKDRSINKSANERANDRINTWTFARTNERASQLANLRTNSTDKLHERHKR